MLDVGTVGFYPDDNYESYVRGCLSIHSSTNLKWQNELLCRNASGLFNVGRIAYNKYKTKCSETNGSIAIPTVEDINPRQNGVKVIDYRHFWTGIERTGPFPDNFTFTESLPFNSTCYDTGNFFDDVYAMPVANKSMIPTLDYVFVLRNKLQFHSSDHRASCVCVKRLFYSVSTVS